MKKKNIAFILFGLAASNLIAIPITMIVFPRLWERLGMPDTASRIGIATSVGVGLTVAFALIVAGIIVYIKFRNE